MEPTAPQVARQILEALDQSTSETVGPIRELIREAGVAPGVHDGDSPDSFTPTKTAEWWLGQVASIIDNESWWAVNSLINWGDAHLPKPVR